MFKFSKKNYFQRDIEPHEVLLDKLARKNEEVLGISEKKLEVPIFRSLQFFFYFSIFLFFLLFLQTFNLQLLKGRDLQKKAQNNRYIIHKIQAQRGVIYDRNFIQLVFNQEVFDLVFEKENFPKSVSERKKILEEISQILKIDQKELERKIEKENPPVLISKILTTKD
jgi:cell division protein FtsI/penicillin-binding protein 2